MFRGADVGSDHNLAVSTIRLSLAALKQHKQQLRYNTSNLLNKDILTSFNTTISGRFQALPELHESSDINKEWTNFTRTVNKLKPQQNTLATEGYITEEVNGVSGSPLIQGIP